MGKTELCVCTLQGRVKVYFGKRKERKENEAINHLEAKNAGLKI